MNFFSVLMTHFSISMSSQYHSYFQVETWTTEYNGSRDHKISSVATIGGNTNKGMVVNSSSDRSRSNSTENHPIKNKKEGAIENNVTGKKIPRQKYYFSLLEVYHCVFLTGAVLIAVSSATTRTLVADEISVWIEGLVGDDGARRATGNGYYKT